jgi:hypothetical protein
MTFWIAAAVATSATVQAYGQIQAGKAQEAELKRQAEERRIQAEGEELQRQEALGRALAANAVAAGMSGIKMEGTPASIALETAETASLGEGMARLSARLEQAQLRRQAKSARVGSQYQAAGTLLQGAADTAQALPD